MNDDTIGRMEPRIVSFMAALEEGADSVGTCGPGDIEDAKCVESPWLMLADTVIGKFETIFKK